MLTHEDNKHPALSGLAYNYQGRWNDLYHAEIWQRQLWRQLQWYMGPTTYPPRWPSEYRAPSWSWASVEGHISSHPINDHADSLLPWNVTLETTAKGADLRE